jgi:hypothetical protein
MLSLYYLSLFLLVQGIPIQAQQSGTISGVLKDSEGNPVHGIRLAAVARPDSPLEAFTSSVMASFAETDAQGRFTLVVRQIRRTVVVRIAEVGRIRHKDGGDSAIPE